MNGSRVALDTRQNRLLLPLGAGAPDTINVVVEIPSGSRNKYEYDKALDIFRLERARTDYDGADTKLAAAVRAYGRRLPHRVDDLGVQRPSLLERFAGGRAYANVVATAERRSEIRRTVDQCVAELDELVRTIDAILEARGRVVRRGLQTSAGFTKAVRRDPLLENAYKLLVAAMDDRKKHVIGLDDLAAFYAERTGT